MLKPSDMSSVDIDREISEMISDGELGIGIHSLGYSQRLKDLMAEQEIRTGFICMNYSSCDSIGRLEDGTKILLSWPINTPYEPGKILYHHVVTKQSTPDGIVLFTPPGFVLVYMGDKSDFEASVVWKDWPEDAKYIELPKTW